MASEDSIDKNKQALSAPGKPSKESDHTKNRISPISASVSEQFDKGRAHYEVTWKTEKHWWHDKVKPNVEIAGILLLGVYIAYTIKMYSANQKAADAAASSADASAKELELSERPWVDSAVGINGPFAFDVNGAHLNVLITTRNTGHTPALNTTVSPYAMIEFGGPNPYQFRDQKCREVVQIVRTSKSGVSLFPGTTIPYPTTVDLSKEDIEKASKQGKGQISFLKLIVCIAYQPAFGDKLYTTGYIFDVSRFDEKNLPRIDFSVGQDIDAVHLRLQLGPDSIVAN